MAFIILDWLTREENLIQFEFDIHTINWSIDIKDIQLNEPLLMNKVCSKLTSINRNCTSVYIHLVCLSTYKFISITGAPDYAHRATFA